MALTLSGRLYDPYGDVLAGASIRFRAVSTSTQILKSYLAEAETDSSGDYSISVRYGLYDISVRQSSDEPWYIIARDIPVTTDSTSNDLNALIVAYEGDLDATPEIVLEIEAIAATATAAAASASSSAQEASDAVAAVTSDASSLPVTSSSGSQSRTLAARAADRANVKDFGADGSSSDPASFQAAIDSTSGNVAFIEVPSGSYGGDMSSLDDGGRSVVLVEGGGVSYSGTAPSLRRSGYAIGSDGRVWSSEQRGMLHYPSGLAGEPQSLRIQRVVNYTGGTAPNPSALSAVTTVNTDNGTKENVIISEINDNGTGSSKSRTAVMATGRRNTENNNNIITGNFLAEDYTGRASSVNNGSLVACEINIRASGPDNATNGRRFGLDMTLLEQQSSSDGATSGKAAIRIRNSSSADGGANTWENGVLVKSDGDNGGVTRGYSTEGPLSATLYARQDNIPRLDLAALLSSGYLSDYSTGGYNSSGTLVNYSSIKTAVLTPTDGAHTGRIDFIVKSAASDVIPLGLSNGARFGTPAGGFRGNGTINVAGGIYRDGVQVVGVRQSSIANASSGTEVSTINSILAALRAHGLIDQ